MTDQERWTSAANSTHYFRTRHLTRELSLHVYFFIDACRSYNELIDSSFFFSIATVFCPINSCHCLFYKSVFVYVVRGVTTFGPVKQIVTLAPSTSFFQELLTIYLSDTLGVCWKDRTLQFILTTNVSRMLDTTIQRSIEMLDNWIMCPLFTSEFRFIMGSDNIVAISRSAIHSETFKFWSHCRWIKKDITQSEIKENLLQLKYILKKPFPDKRHCDMNPPTIQKNISFSFKTFPYFNSP